MMQSILLPAASSQLKEGTPSSKSANVEDSDLLNTEGQEKKNNADFSSLLDALLPEDTLQGKQLMAEEIKVEEETEVGDLLAESLAENSDADENDVMLSGNESEQGLIEGDPSQLQDSETKLSRMDSEGAVISSQYFENSPELDQEAKAPVIAADSFEIKQVDDKQAKQNSNDSEGAVISSQYFENSPELDAEESISRTPELDHEAKAPVIAADSSEINQVDDKQAKQNSNDSENIEIAPKTINNLDEVTKNEAALTNADNNVMATSHSGDLVENDKLKATDSVNQPDKVAVVDTNNNASIINLSPEKTKQATDILADIENAQKVNTQVNQTEKNLVSNTEKSLLFADSESEKEKVNKKEAAISSDFDKIVLKESVNVKEKTVSDEPIKLDQTAKIPEKAEQFLSPKLMDRASLSTATETHQFRPFTSTASDFNKLTSQSQSMNANVNASAATTMNDSLALQSKQSAALLGQRVLMMLANDKKEIQVRLDPAELGSMNIKLQVQQDQVQLTIQAQAGQTRDLLEQNLPRLREQLAQQGVNLGETNIEQQNQGHQQKHNKNDVIHQGKEGRSEQLSVSETESEVWLAREVSYTPQGIDFYA